MTGFDSRTFKVMSDMINSEPDVPLYFATQTEYREEVSGGLSRSSGLPPQLTMTIEGFQPEPTGEAAAVSQLGLISRYHPDVSPAWVQGI